MDYAAARKRLGGKLRELRTAQRLTQEQLAEAVGKTVEHISYLERGERSPSFEILLDIAHALGTSPSVLLAGVELQGAPAPSIRPRKRSSPSASTGGEKSRTPNR